MLGNSVMPQMAAFCYSLREKSGLTAVSRRTSALFGSRFALAIFEALGEAGVPLGTFAYFAYGIACLKNLPRRRAGFHRTNVKQPSARHCAIHAGSTGVHC